MGAFIKRHYNLVFGVLMVAIVGLAFYVGMLEGKQVIGNTISLSCTNDVLSTLTIPTRALAAGTTTESSLAARVTPLQDPAVLPTTGHGAFAGSKNGTKYYTPGCPGLDRIKPENIIWFQTAEDATLQGYTPGSC